MIILLKLTIVLLVILVYCALIFRSKIGNWFIVQVPKIKLWISDRYNKIKNYKSQRRIVRDNIKTTKKVVNSHEQTIPKGFTTSKSTYNSQSTKRYQEFPTDKYDRVMEEANRTLNKAMKKLDVDLDKMGKQLDEAFNPDKFINGTSYSPNVRKSPVTKQCIHCSPRVITSGMMKVSVGGNSYVTRVFLECCNICDKKRAWYYGQDHKTKQYFTDENAITVERLLTKK